MATTETQPSRKKAGANWWRSPQRLWLRRALFQLHLWLGIALTLYVSIIGVSGATLVFKDEMEKAAHPELYHVAPASPQITLEQAVHQIEADRPGWRVSGLEEFEQHSGAVMALMGRRGAAPNANYRAVFFDPNTGHVLEDRMRFDGFLGWMTNLHFYLLSGKTGLLVSGWMAVGLLLLCLSGVILWWPGVQRAASALILRLHRSRHRSSFNWKRLNWDLHAVVGFWSCAALIVVTVTGLYFAFPKVIGNATVLATGGSLVEARQQAEAPDRKPSASTLPVMTVDQAIERARIVLPKDAPAGYISLPYKAGAPYSVTGYYRGALPFSELVRVSLDPRTGDVLGYTDTTRQMRGLRVVQYFFTVHFGSFGGSGWLGAVVKILWAAMGLAPALLAVTGCIMYWHRKLRPMLKTR